MLQNGFDMSQLPPLRWSPEDTRYPSYSAWVDAVAALRTQLREDPEYAWHFVLPDSPLERGPTPETVEAALGKPGLRRYAQQLRRGL